MLILVRVPVVEVMVMMVMEKNMMGGDGADDDAVRYMDTKLII